MTAHKWDLVRDARRAKRLSLGALGDKLGVSRQYLHNVEMGYRGASIDTVVGLSVHLDLDLTELVNSRPSVVRLDEQRTAERKSA